LERYESQDALDAHGQTDHMKSIGGEMGQYMAGRPEVTILKSI
jgi:quinol monooxygenase YgiN